MNHCLNLSRVLAFAGLLSLLLFRAGFAWGDRTHEAIARGAAVAVAEPMRPFFLANSPFLAAHSTDPDHTPDRTQEQKAEHFLDLDLFNPPELLPHERKLAEQKFGADVMAQRGLLPWAVEREYNRLVAALKNKDWPEARMAAAHLAHFVSDATMPLHATANYDGQNTGNAGLHMRVEIEMIYRYQSPEYIAAEETADIKDPVEWTFASLADSLGACKTLFDADTAARKAAPLDSERYYAELNKGCGETIRRRMELAATALASFWTKAWKEAGSPHLPVETALVVIEPSRFALRETSAERAASLRVSPDVLAGLLKPFDAVAYCETSAPSSVRSASLQFVTAADGVELADKTLGHRFSGELRYALESANHALEQFPHSRRVIILVSDGWKPDPAVLEQARLMKEKGVVGLFIVRGAKESSPQAEELAKEAGGSLIRLAEGDATTTDKVVKEQMTKMMTEGIGRR